jgi:prepilin-type N-terminal cleavage/methylation domain-containing protein
MRRASGFSLIELLVVVVIVAAVAAFVLPRLIMSRLDHNQEIAIRTLQEIGALGAEHAAVNGQRFADLRSIVGAGHLDARYLSPRGVDGYRYLEGPVAGTGKDSGPPATGIIAEPLPGHGRYVFAVSADKVVRYQAAAPGFPLPAGIKPGDPAPTARAQ